MKFNPVGPFGRHAIWQRHNLAARRENVKVLFLSTTSGRAGGLTDVERLKAAGPFGQSFHTIVPKPRSGFVGACALAIAQLQNFHTWKWLDQNHHRNNALAII